MIVSEQAHTWAAMAALGMALGGVYDGLGLLRRGRMAWAADLAFGPVCAAAMIAVGLMLRTDVFRLYAFAGCALGMAVYMMTMGVLVRKVTSAVQAMTRKRQKLDENEQNDAGNWKRKANLI